MAQKAGRICGNPLCGLNERVCINVRKIFDGCITRYRDRAFELTFIGEPTGTAPFTFVDARSNGESQISNLIITPVDENRNRIQMDVTTPITVTYTDSTGATYSVASSVTIPRDIILTLPEDSLSPYSIEVTVGFASTIGEISGNTASVRACVVQITRVIVNVDILVPSYGYCEYPPCDEYSNEICQGLFDLPIFPNNNQQ